MKYKKPKLYLVVENGRTFEVRAFSSTGGGKGRSTGKVGRCSDRMARIARKMTRISLMDAAMGCADSIGAHHDDESVRVSAPNADHVRTCMAVQAALVSRHGLRADFSAASDVIRNAAYAAKRESEDMSSARGVPRDAIDIDAIIAMVS